MKVHNDNKSLLLSPSLPLSLPLACTNTNNEPSHNKHGWMNSQRLQPNSKEYDDIVQYECVLPTAKRVRIITISLSLTPCLLPFPLYPSFSNCYISFNLPTMSPSAPAGRAPSIPPMGKIDTATFISKKEN